eukprot:jgi/Galph1/1088/GphlegSOOS_G5758.1
MAKKSLVRPPTKLRDPSTCSDPTRYFTRRISLDLEIDPVSKVLTGSVLLEVEILEVEDDPNLVLDIRSLEILQVQDQVSGKNFPFDIEQKKLGDALKIHLKGFCFPDQRIRVRIYYATQGEGVHYSTGEACGWLSPEQTAGGKLPFLFTQSQQIHARSIFPCQDTPSVKAPFIATVSVPSDFQVVMSAILVHERRNQMKNDGSLYNVFFFEQHLPVPSYLVSFAMGELECQELSERCRIWAEPTMIEAACFEFGSTDTFLKIAESICGVYVWSRFDILCLPPSFPFGAMENPCLTFVTPTLLAGDCSLVSVIIHQIAHCWGGNLVTCCSWEDLWLNEGMALFVARKIIARSEYRDNPSSGSIEAFFGLETYLGRIALHQALESFGKDHKFTRLISDLSDGSDPNEVFTPVVYEKGFNLLLKLEHEVGEEKFLLFIRSFFERFQFQSITTADFITYFTEYLNVTLDGLEGLTFDEFDWDKWLYSCGGPPEYPPVDLSLVNHAKHLAFHCIETEAKTLSTHSIEGWGCNQLIVFLDTLLSHGGLSWEAVRRLDMQLNLNRGPRGKNAEIRLLWLKLALNVHYEPAVDNATEFVTSQGRLRYLRPIYKELHLVFPKGTFAINLFTKNRNKYHSIAVKLLTRDFGLE